MFNFIDFFANFHETDRNTIVSYIVLGMGGRLSSPGSSTAEPGHGHPGTGELSGDLSVNRPIHAVPSPNRASLPSSAAGARSQQAESSAGGAIGGGSGHHQGSGALKHNRMPDESAMVNRRQLVELLAASGVSGRTVIARTHRQAVNRNQSDGATAAGGQTTHMPFLVAFRGTNKTYYKVLLIVAMWRKAKWSTKTILIN